jgi:hypothetical protein
MRKKKILKEQEKNKNKKSDGIQLGMVVYRQNFSCSRGSRVQDQSRQSYHETLSEKKLKAKRILVELVEYLSSKLKALSSIL